jgi:hypothetical protein
MKMSNDYIPESDGNLLVWSKNLFDVVDAKAKAFGLDPLEYGPILDLVGKYEAALAAALDPNHGSVDIQAKNDARDEMKGAVRGYVSEHLEHNHLVSDADRKQMGLTVHKDTRTPSPVAEDAPVIEVDSSRIGRLKIYFFVQGSRYRKGKPKGQHCAEMVWIISETPPEKWSDMAHSLVDTNSPFELVFEHDQLGQTIWFAVRWENTRGEKGPWTDMIKATIPK